MSQQPKRFRYEAVGDDRNMTKTINNPFNLDMVEINAKEDWQSATFMVGKYITNNLFVTYLRGFGENKE